MIKNWPLLACAIFLMSFASPSWAEGAHGRPIHGLYVAELDLRPLGIDRIEKIALYLHKDGAVSYISEHELDDLESAGVGTWKRLRTGRIGLGVLTYRFGIASACPLVGLTSPPDNCVLKLGANLRQKKGGALVGKLLLTLEGAGQQLVIPVPLPFTMRPEWLVNFPGAFGGHYHH